MVVAPLSIPAVLSRRRERALINGVISAADAVDELICGISLNGAWRDIIFSINFHRLAEYVGGRSWSTACPFL